MHLPRRQHPSPLVDRRPATRRGWLRPVATSAALVLGVSLLAACSGDDETPDVPTVEPATAVQAPAGAAPQPAGTVVAAPAGARALAASGSTVGVLSPDGTELLRYDARDVTAPPNTTAVPALTALTADRDGGFLGAGPGQLVAVDEAGEVRSEPLDTDAPSAVVRAATGDIVVGTGDGRVLIYGEDFEKRHDARDFVGVDSLTAAPASAEGLDDQVVVLDRAQSSVTPIDPRTGDLGPALRAGNGATTSTVDPFGRILVANTRDGEILGFYGAPLVMRFRHPVAGGPYAVDYDDTRDLLWVSTTGDNEVVAYDLADGEPSEKQRFASVVQPDRITVDDAGTLFVLSARDGGLQAISRDTPAGTSAAPGEPGR